MLCQDISITVFFSFRHDIFIIKQHQVRCYHFFIFERLLKVWIWYRFQNRIESYSHDDGEQSGFKKKVCIKTQSKMSCNLYIVGNEDSKCIWQKLYLRVCQMPGHIQHEERWLRWIVVEQVNYYFPLIFPERNCNRKKVIVIYSKKMKAKCMKEDV